MEDLIGLLILSLTAIGACILGGLSILCVADLLTSSLSWLGAGPVTGWSLLGAIGGAVYGVIKGLKAKGRADDLRLFYFGGGVFVTVLLAAGLASPAGRALLGR